jgi:hypothetical protein
MDIFLDTTKNVGHLRLTVGPNALSLQKTEAQRIQESTHKKGIQSLDSEAMAENEILNSVLKCNAK